ncbi:hypothetical protein CPB83DRAFT_312273 [Crepidotus variabilis]|uniref:Coenzyme Q-binding protein COQ10 START domain-containing protein n=1 Tax=Crepidotus variabilis TaxID=179855 RepID=A0A9P6EG70_9AGAR|nr:hypothetical protein CPB83DRAFT_312273 [Crepidotus variabilis]
MIRIASILTLLCTSIVAQSPPSSLPPTDPGIFTAQASIIIDAPIEAVWAILLDFPKYPQWNPFVRSQTVTNTLWIPTEDQVAYENFRLIIQAQIPPLTPPVNENTPPNPFHAQTAFENITKIDAVNHQAFWRSIMLPQEILDSERMQVLSVVGVGKTYYEAREVFKGPASYVVDALFAEGLQKGFSAQAVALKARAEM